MPIILTEEKEKEKRREGGREAWKTCACMHTKTHTHTFMLTERMNKRGWRHESSGGAEEDEELKERKRGMMKEGGELGGRGQREIGGERIRL